MRTVQIVLRSTRIKADKHAYTIQYPFCSYVLRCSDIHCGICTQQSIHALTSSPIALVSCNTEMFSVTPLTSRIFCDWLSTRSRMTLPELSMPDSHTVGGRLQGRSVKFTMLRLSWIRSKVTLQWTASHWSFLLQLRNCTPSDSLCRALQVGVAAVWEIWQYSVIHIGKIVWLQFSCYTPKTFWGL